MPQNAVVLWKNNAAINTRTACQLPHLKLLETCMNYSLLSQSLCEWLSVTVHMDSLFSLSPSRRRVKRQRMVSGIRWNTEKCSGHFGNLHFPFRLSSGESDGLMWISHCRGSQHEHSEIIWQASTSAVCKRVASTASLTSICFPLSTVTPLSVRFNLPPWRLIMLRPPCAETLIFRLPPPVSHSFAPCCYS